MNGYRWEYGSGEQGRRRGFRDDRFDRGGYGATRAVYAG